jgi:hypothetical protein
MQAAVEGHLEVVKYLVQEAGADKEKGNEVSVTLLITLLLSSSPLLGTMLISVCVVTVVNSMNGRRLCVQLTRAT